MIQPKTMISLGSSITVLALCQIINAYTERIDSNETDASIVVLHAMSAAERMKSGFIKNLCLSKIGDLAIRTMDRRRAAAIIDQFPEELREDLRVQLLIADARSTEIPEILKKLDGISDHRKREYAFLRIAKIAAGRNRTELILPHIRDFGERIHVLSLVSIAQGQASAGKADAARKTLESACGALDTANFSIEELFGLPAAIAKAFAQMGDYQEAQKYAQLDPTSPPISETLTEEIASIALANNDQAQATRFANLIKTKIRRDRLLCEIAVVSKDINEAKQRVLAIADPNLRDLGRAEIACRLVAQGDTHKALETVKQILDPGIAVRTLGRCAAVYSSEKKHAEDVATFLEYARNTARDAPTSERAATLYALAEAYAMLGDTNQAISISMQIPPGGWRLSTLEEAAYESVTSRRETQTKKWISAMEKWDSEEQMRTCIGILRALAESK